MRTFSKLANEEFFYDFKAAPSLRQAMYQMIEWFCDRQSVRRDQNLLDPILQIWLQGVKNLLQELYNSFTTANFLTCAISTRLLIEEYVLIDLIVHDPTGKAGQNWLDYQWAKKLKTISRNPYFTEQDQSCAIFMLKLATGKYVDFEQVKNRKVKTNATYEWLKDSYATINNFHDACKLVDEQIYADYQLMCDYTHGQDIYIKTFNFSFYNDWFVVLEICIHYMINLITLFKTSHPEELTCFSQKLEKSLEQLKKEFYKRN